MQKPSFTRRALVTALAGVALTASLGVLAQGYQVHYRVAGIVPAAEPVPETDFTSHTFTNCGQTGRFGPSLAQCLSAYSDAEVLKSGYQFDVTSGIQLWTAPVSGAYRIEAWGAKGGGSKGGSGAKMGGDFNLESGQVLKILIGQRGTSNNGRSTGGGGATFVADFQNNPLIVAGGGAGGINGLPGDPGVTTMQSSQSRNFGISLGGMIYKENDPYDKRHSSGGAGFNGDGEKGRVSETARSFINGGSGATGYGDGEGGFGGGGGYLNNADNVAGGGGGYTGGHGNWGSNTHRAGGGGSYNAGTNQSNQSGANSGHGRVTITLLSQ